MTNVANIINLIEAFAVISIRQVHTERLLYEGIPQKDSGWNLYGNLKVKMIKNRNGVYYLYV